MNHHQTVLVKQIPKKLAKRASLRLQPLAKRRYEGPLLRGLSPQVDLASALAPHQTGVVFDVGANIGQSAEHFLQIFPTAKVFAFEPVSATFRELEATLSGEPERTECLQLALSDQAGTAEISVGDTSTQATLHRAVAPGGRSEPVTLETLDGFCSARHIDTIDFLKIDTEGNDLRVLQGATVMLGDQRIRAVQVEAGMHPDNALHVPLETLKSFLESMNYRCFGIYEQAAEWTTGQPFLRRVNALFIPATLS